MDAATIHDPNLDYLYLNDMIGPEHPMYEEMKRRYATTPDGKRIEQFRRENDKYRDGLQISTHGKLDNAIRNEGVTFTGDPTDRLAKIRAIRLHRSQIEDEKVKRMTTEERAAYLAEAETKRKQDEKRAADRLKVDEESIRRREAVRQGKRSALDEYRYKREMERKAQRDKSREFLKEDLARRTSKVNPVDARALAIKEREQKEKELADAAAENDAAAAAEKLKLTKAPQEPADDTKIKAPAAKDQAAKKAAAVAERKETRRAELADMDKPKLDVLMKAGDLSIGIGMTNAQKADAILKAEYPIE